MKWEEYYPLRVGTEWTYATGKKTATTRVSGKKPIGKVETFVVEEDRGDSTVTAYLTVDSDGVHLHQHQDKKLEEPALLIKFPLKKGTTWEISREVKGTVEDEEEIEVVAGKFKCVRVKIESPGATTQQWLAPGVGTVKLRVVSEGKEQVTTLVKFKAGKD